MAIINVIIAALVWISMLVLIPAKRIERLLPIGFTAAVLLFIPLYIAIRFGWVRYTSIIVPIAGVPLFQLAYAFAFGILLIHFMKKEWRKKLPIIVIFTVINEIFTSVIQALGVLVFQGRYNIWIDALITLLVFSLGVGIAEGLWKDRIYGEEIYS